MSAHDPQDQHHDAPVRPAGPTQSAPGAAPSVRDVLASCAAARTVSTPPADAAPSADPARTEREQPPGPADDARGRDAA
jgi:hypothetical protein